MSNYPDDEPDEGEYVSAMAVAASFPGKMDVTVTGVSPRPLAEAIVGLVHAQIRDQLSKAIDRTIKKAVRDEVDAIVRGSLKERVDKEIAATMEEGWIETDGYGSPKGTPPLTLRARIKLVLDRKGDSYNRESYLDQWVKAGIANELEKVMRAEVEDARKRLREAFDEVLKSKFTDTIKKALGLKE